MTTGPSWKVPADDKAWIGEKILAQEDATLAALAAKRLQDADAPDRSAADRADAPVIVDPAAEVAAYKELLTQLAARDEGDADTVVVGLTLDEFTATTFTPTERDNPEPQES